MKRFYPIPDFFIYLLLAKNELHGILRYVKQSWNLNIKLK